MTGPSPRAVALPLRASAYVSYFFLYLPVIVIAIYSFNAARYGLHWTHFSLRWYADLAHNDEILSAARNSIVLAVTSTAISTVLGSALGYGLYRYRFRGARIVDWLMYIPIVTPDIVLAIGLLLTYAILRSVGSLFELGLGTMIVGHVTFQIAFVAIVIRSRLAALDPALEEAARDLYAGPLATVRYVVLPLSVPALTASALLAFTLSIDDFVISFFTSGPTSTTLPIFIYSSVKRGITPDIDALSTIIVIATTLLVFLTDFVGRAAAAPKEAAAPGATLPVH